MPDKKLSYYEIQHRNNLVAISRNVKRIFDKTQAEALSIVQRMPNYGTGAKAFSFNDFPGTKKQVDQLLTRLHDSLDTVVVNGIQASYDLSQDKNSDMLDRLFAGSLKSLTDKEKQTYFGNHQTAVDQFIKRKAGGLKLSDRVWRYTDQFKKEIETSVTAGIMDGVPATSMAAKVKQYLKEPNRTFRRVRDEYGNLKLSKAAKAYHPGQGVYRSSYKNAFRMTRTETNIAYRAADSDRWKQLDFVKGIHIETSHSHSVLDMCDFLAGDYPPDFVFTGWHPQCLCIATPILMTEEEMTKHLKNGTLHTLGKEQKVKALPGNFNKYVAQNQLKFNQMRVKPFFVTDNSSLISRKVTKPVEPPKPINKVKTAAEKAAIQKAWNTRTLTNKYKDQLAEIDKYIKSISAAQSPILNQLIKSTQTGITKGQSVASIDKKVRELKHKVNIKKAYDQKVQLDTLSDVLPTVHKYKTQFTIDELKTTHKAVKSKLATFKGLDLNKQLKKAKFEVQWVESEKKYKTWKVAQDAYKEFEKQVQHAVDVSNFDQGKKKIIASLSHEYEYAVHSTSKKLKSYVESLESAEYGTSSISQLEKISEAFKFNVAKLESAKAKRKLKKGDVSVEAAPDKTSFSSEAYTKTRKDAAFWEREGNKQRADNYFRPVSGKVWRETTPDHRNAAYEYTGGSSRNNEPLRGINYSGFKENAKDDTRLLTELINRSSYDKDVWLQRGIGLNAIKHLFGVNITPSLITSNADKTLKSLVGKTGTEKAFMSTAVGKGWGFEREKVILNIYAPKGTKMLYSEPFSIFGGDNVGGFSGRRWDGIAKAESLKNEMEVIVQQGTTLRITKAEYDGKQLFIDAEIIEQKPVKVSDIKPSLW